jgi:hypothetical protein
MRVLFLLLGLFVIHYVLAQVYPPYRTRVREFDRKLTWISVILVLYMVGVFVYNLYSFILAR